MHQEKDISIYVHHRLTKGIKDVYIHCRLVGVPSCCNNSHYRKGRLLTMISDSVHRTLESEEDRTISQSGFLDTVRCSIAITLYYISLLSGLGNICSIG